MYNHYPKCGLEPPSPGELLYEEYLEPLDISQKELAEYLDCDYGLVNRIVNNKARVTPSIAVKLAHAFETTPQFWLNAQAAVDLQDSKPPSKSKQSLIRKKGYRPRIKKAKR